MNEVEFRAREVGGIKDPDSREITGWCYTYAMDVLESVEKIHACGEDDRREHPHRE